MKPGDLVHYYDTKTKEHIYGIVLKRKKDGCEVLWFDNEGVSGQEEEGVAGVKVVSRCDESR